MAIRALLVDDVDDVRRLVRTALRLRGDFQVVAEAGDGAEAVRLARSHHPDVVVLDLGLPDLAGREVLSRLREASPESKIVVFSGADAHDEWVRGHADGYVGKDAELEHLVDLLTALGSSPDEQRALELPKSLASAWRARQFVTETLDAWGISGVRDAALLVTSELAANALTHADSAFRLQLSRTPGAVRIDVVDHGQGSPEPQPESMSEEHGRGLLLIDAMATAWGIDDVAGDGKAVWAEISLPPVAPPAALS